MATEDKKISALAEWLWDDIEDLAEMIVAYGGNNFRIALSAIKKYVLGNSDINGTGSSDIPTNGGIQTLSNKTLINTVFNSGGTLNSAITATELNYLEGLDVNVADKFGELESNAAGLESSIDEITAGTRDIGAPKIWSDKIEATATTVTLGASTIESVSNIDINSLVVSVGEVNDTETYLINNSNVTIHDDGSENLTSIVLDPTVVGKTYRFIVYYRLS